MPFDSFAGHVDLIDATSAAGDRNLVRPAQSLGRSGTWPRRPRSSHLVTRSRACP